ncbi:hypothetical protein CVT26_002117 [Gymnopilus dilepis]|uniref:Uncharacterized protein n=1 Tax=Gymnopilus dilepis TaxID=231916 RepID=A0A409VEI1_9AGAR|nr:hypothetical protein CVT26_002117 [Gymnopilus dilepis]
MSQPTEQTPGSANLNVRHVSRVSLDTNASGIAESTISLGLSRFPEPPSSIPSTPLRSNFDSSSPSKVTPPNFPPISPLRKLPQPDKPSNPPTSFSRFTHRSPSFQPPRSNTIPPSGPPESTATSFDWRDGSSNIDVDADEDRLLPTSFITSLLQENKEIRKNNRASYTSDAFSGISEMTYPPVMNPHRSWSTNQKTQDSRPPPSSFPRSVQSSNRLSGDSETLHSLQAYSPVSPTYGFRSAGLGSKPSESAASQISSTFDSDTLRSNDKSGHEYHKKLSTTYESGDELLVDYKTFNSVYSPALPSTAGTNKRFPRDSRSKERRRHDSIHSNKSFSPSLISRISGISLRRVLPWRVKPLPPVPAIPSIPLPDNEEHRKEEESTPLPELVNRAGALHDLLDRGYHPHQSFSTYQELPSATPATHDEAEARKFGMFDPHANALSYRSPLGSGKEQPPQRVNVGTFSVRKKWLYLLFSVILISVLAAIGAGVGVTLGRKKQQQPQFDCTGNFTGTGCNLGELSFTLPSYFDDLNVATFPDATCICTSTTPCNGLAKAIVDLLPIVNRQFNTNVSSSNAYLKIWMLQGSPATSTCSSQALLLDVGNGITQTTYPNRTQWTQAAMLWNALQTQDTVASQTMKKFVQSLPWSQLGSADGPVNTASSSFSTTIAGFTYNFASQNVTEPPASFVTLGQPSNGQISQVSTNALSTLDRMYTYAQASATQQSTALKAYWTTVLLQRSADLATFKTALSVSPIMLPFNATSPSIRNLYATTPSSPFPPPLSCFPGLSSAVMQQVNAVETNVFGLSAVATANQFNPSCYRDRPVYGILDLLRLRLPFLDTQTGVVRQAAVLSKDVTPRVVLYNGVLMSNLLNGTASRTTFSPSQLDPRQYGTMSLSDHVILQYLSSIANVTLATALVQFVLATATQLPVPPTSSSMLLQSLASLPTLEVAVFGDVQPTDLTSTVSPFTNPSGSLFFGSDDGSAMRNWTINTVGGTAVWTQNATSPLVVHDKSLGDTTITQTWNIISSVIANNVKGIGLANITSTFQNTGDFSP